MNVILPPLGCGYHSADGQWRGFQTPKIPLPFRNGLLALEGLNGTGKSTFLNALADARGEIEFPDRTDANRLAEAGVFLLPQRFESILFPHKPVWWNIVLPHLIRRPASSARGTAAFAWEQARRFPLDVPLLERYPHQLSGGQKQMVALLQASQADSPVILLDEPTSALNAAAMPPALSLIREMSARSLVIVSTHHQLGEKQSTLAAFPSMLPPSELTLTQIHHA